MKQSTWQYWFMLSVLWCGLHIALYIISYIIDLEIWIISLSVLSLLNLIACIVVGSKIDNTQNN